MKLDFYQAIDYTKKIHDILTRFNFGGTSLPGKLLRKFYPNFLSESQIYSKFEKFAITGTNGKTTTAGIFAAILKEAGKSVIHNELGANMPNGIATSIALGLKENFARKGKNASVDNFVIESDEAYLFSLFSEISFDTLIVTNLFRDQLDRWGELDTTRKKIRNAIRLNPEIRLILNADDPSLFELDKDIDDTPRKKLYFGFENVEYIDYNADSKSPKEIIYCPQCKEPLEYTKNFYSQLGLWQCKCKVKRPTPEVLADVKVFRHYSILNVKYRGTSIMYKVNLTGLYNAYNALAAIAMGYSAGIDRKVIERAILNYKPVFGREQTENIRGTQVKLYLIKNPTGASEVLRGLKDLKDTRLLISINDNYADGRDVSWLWDADFDILEKFNNKIYITGTRADDMALRLKYAGFNPSLMVIDNDIKKVFEYALNEISSYEKLVVLPTYTSLLKLNKIIKKLK